ncbi:RDD family protein [Neiella marina]|uniref:RDD family protein n=1 Tax=Neiella holothuriorum TaxID=2870530 RepID=A0ABS7EC21_9GAMM|nr:RDD family protein [Neiella holothuriorum]MBW8189874.1 RDD family protein [Neiella holothuriorum]
MALSTADGSETRSKITPYAFRIAPQLLNLPLARPWRRGMAMLIDLCFIGAAATFLDAEWALPIFATLWLIKQSLHGFKKRFALVATLIVIVVLAILFDESEIAPSNQQMTDIATVVGHLPELIALEQCTDTACAQTQAVKLQQSLAQSELSPIVQYHMLKESLNESVLPASEIPAILGPEPEQTAAVETNQAQQLAAELDPQSVDADPQLVALDDDNDDEMSAIEIDDASNCAEAISPMALLRGTLKDLGLGFSWAILYFSILTSWFNGQTIGKRLMRIRVLRLDGQKLTMWGCFGRYGGYIAGLATGLLGFLQIYWDPNRQAIQDKISTTAVVYRSRKPITMPQTTPNDEQH